MSKSAVKFRNRAKRLSPEDRDLEKIHSKYRKQRSRKGLKDEVVTLDESTLDEETRQKRERDRRLEAEISRNRDHELAERRALWRMLYFNILYQLSAGHDHSTCTSSKDCTMGRDQGEWQALLNSVDDSTRWKHSNTPSDPEYVQRVRDYLEWVINRVDANGAFIPPPSLVPRVTPPSTPPLDSLSISRKHPRHSSLSSSSASVSTTTRRRRKVARCRLPINPVSGLEVVTTPLEAFIAAYTSSGSDMVECPWGVTRKPKHIAILDERWDDNLASHETTDIEVELDKSGNITRKRITTTHKEKSLPSKGPPNVTIIEEIGSDNEEENVETTTTTAASISTTVPMPAFIPAGVTTPPTSTPTNVSTPPKTPRRAVLTPVSKKEREELDIMAAVEHKRAARALVKKPGEATEKTEQEEEQEEEEVLDSDEDDDEDPGARYEEIEVDEGDWVQREDWVDPADVLETRNVRSLAWKSMPFLEEQRTNHEASAAVERRQLGFYPDATEDDSNDDIEDLVKSSICYEVPGTSFFSRLHDEVKEEIASWTTQTIKLEIAAQSLSNSEVLDELIIRAKKNLEIAEEKKKNLFKRSWWGLPVTSGPRKIHSTSKNSFDIPDKNDTSGVRVRSLSVAIQMNPKLPFEYLNDARALEMWRMLEHILGISKIVPRCSQVRSPNESVADWRHRIRENTTQRAVGKSKNFRAWKKWYLFEVELYFEMVLAIMIVTGRAEEIRAAIQPQVPPSETIKQG